MQDGFWLANWLLHLVFKISYSEFQIANFVSRISNEPPELSYDSPCYTFRDIAYCCIFALHEPSLETVIYITLYQQMHWMFLWYSLLCLTFQNSHLFRNVIQCKTRRKHMRTNLQRQYNLLHSYMDDCCIRWCLQKQYHIVKYMKTVTSIYVLLSMSVIQSWTVSISWVSPVSTDWNPCCVAPNFRILQPFYTWMRKHDRTWLLEILASLDAFKIPGYTVSMFYSFIVWDYTGYKRLWWNAPHLWCQTCIALLMCYIYGSCLVLLVWHTIRQSSIPCTHLYIRLNALVIGSTSKELQKKVSIALQRIT